MKTFFILCTLISSTWSFYISFHAKGFKDGDSIQLFYNKVFSDKTQLSFAYAQLPFVCKPNSTESNTNEKWLNLGEVLRGDRIISSNLFDIQMNKPVDCKVLCSTGNLIEADVAFARQLISLEYKVEWIVDDLPVATARTYTTPSKKIKQYEMGFLLGNFDEQTKTAYMNNHVHLKFLYENKNGLKYIVGVEAIAASLDNTDKACPIDTKKPALKLQTQASQAFTFTYSVSWHEESEIKWQNRWDMYISNNDPHIHWYSIVNSLIILLFLTAMVAIIILRTLNNDIALYNSEDSKEDPDDIIGWKLLHGDVFRPPRLAGLLSSLVGSGIQFSLAATLTILFAAIGFLNPAYRGGLISSAIFIFVFMGAFAGYFSTRLYKSFKGTSWLKNAFFTSMTPPGIILTTVFLLNFFIWYSGSSNALPFGTFTALGALWFAISTPLIYIGSYFGFKKQAIELPVRIHQIPRQIPEQTWYLQPLFIILISGLIPFAVIFLELFFILKSVWQVDQYYYMFGFLGVVFLLLILTCVEMTVVVIYFSLSAECWRWHWRSFLVSGSSSIYIFMYAVLYYFTKLEMGDALSSVLYFAYSFLACFVYWLCTGTIGFLATYAFVVRMYASIKID